MDARHAIRTYAAAVAAAESLCYKMRGRDPALNAANHPRVVELKRVAFKAMLKEYRGTNLHYKRQLRLAAAGIPNGGTPPLWEV